MASSTVDIYNLALSAIGESALVQGNEDNELAVELCRLHYPGCLRSMLERFEWPWATRQAVLTETVSTYDSTVTYAAAATVRYEGRVYASVAGSNVGHTPDPDLTTYWTLQYPQALGWGYVYTLPTDCVRPVAVLLDGERVTLLSSKTPFDIQRSNDGKSRVLCCDIEPGDFEAFEYIAMPSGDDYPPAYSQLFTDALVYLLASRLAGPITKRPELSVELFKMHDMYAREAIACELNATARDPEPSPSSIRAREA